MTVICLDSRCIDISQCYIAAMQVESAMGHRACTTWRHLATGRKIMGPGGLSNRYIFLPTTFHWCWLPRVKIATSPHVWEVSSVFTLNYTKGHKSYRNNFRVLDQQGLWQHWSAVSSRGAIKDVTNLPRRSKRQLPGQSPTGQTSWDSFADFFSQRKFKVQSTLGTQYSKHTNGRGCHAWNS